MGRSAAITKIKILMLSDRCRDFAKQVDQRPFSKIGGADQDHKCYCRSGTKSGSEKDIKETSNWVPHPENGIYFPEGHEWVMKDVPDGAASLGRTFWLRNAEGVEKPDPDL